jgi:signal transduction histidine kinase
MKLLYRNIFANTIASLIIVFLGGLTIYYFTLGKIREETHEHLSAEKQIIERKLKDGYPIASLAGNVGDKILTEQIPALSGKKPFYKMVPQKEEYEKREAESEEEEEEAEESVFDATALVFEVPAEGKYYRITLIKSFDNDEELGKNILFAVMFSALLMAFTIAVVNIFIYKKLWKPFYAILDQLRHFSISRNSAVVFPEARTQEFSYLSRSLNSMAEKITYDYLALKEFTENASHEIQTPLSVISSKIEMCLQDTKLSSEQAALLIEANHAVNTLATLNKGLITLTKLDNQQVEAPVEISIGKLMEERLLLFEEFIHEKELQVERSIDPATRLLINPLLANILFDNLIKNAIKHNYKGGKILIEVTPQHTSISNTGTEPSVPTEKFFERFYKAGSDDSLGLGLAIVKKICDTNALTISYTYAEGLHTLLIRKKGGI